MAPSHSPRFLYFAHEVFSPAELTAARLDGHLVELGEGYIPADAVETAALRAASLRTLLGDRLAATHLTAAWVHGAVADPPTPHAVQRAVPQRISPVLDHRVVYRDGFLEPADVVRIGGVLVATRSRTLGDLARQRALGEGRAAQLDDALARLASSPEAVRDAIVQLALLHGLPGKPGALELLRDLERAATTR